MKTIRYRRFDGRRGGAVRNLVIVECGKETRPVFTEVEFLQFMAIAKQMEIDIEFVEDPTIFISSAAGW